jgi:hypothetical protein
VRLTACVCVSVPSVPWMLKLNVAVVALPTVTVKAAPPEVGTNDDGVNVQVPGAVPAQLRFTLVLYPWSAVSVPFHVIFCPATVEFGVAVTASVKSGAGGVTVSVNVCVFGAGAPVTAAASVTVLGPPSGVSAPVVTVRVTVTGFAAVGFTALDGENRHAAPVGRPLEQLRTTVPENDPAAVTWTVLAFDVPPCATLSAPGFGVEILKSTTCSVSAASCVIACGSVPTACAVKV